MLDNKRIDFCFAHGGYTVESEKFIHGHLKGLHGGQNYWFCLLSIIYIFFLSVFNQKLVKEFCQIS